MKKRLLLLLLFIFGMSIVAGNALAINPPYKKPESPEKDTGQSGGSDDESPGDDGSTSDDDGGTSDKCKCGDDDSDPDPDPDPDPECLKLSITHGRMLNEPTLPDGKFFLYYLSPSPAVFSPQGMHYSHPLFTGIVCVKTEELDPGIAREVTLFTTGSHFVTYQFLTGESVGCPVGGGRNYVTRLKMVDESGAPVTENPACYDLYPGGGNFYRYSAATKEVVSVTTAAGRVLSAADPGVSIEVIEDDNSILRQIYSGTDGLADIVITDEYSYEIRLYSQGNAGSKNAEGLYEPTGDPHTVWRIENPTADIDNLENVRITRTSGETSYVHDWKYNYSVQDWKVTSGSGMRVSSKMRYGDGQASKVIKIVTDESGTLAYKEEINTQSYSFGGAVKNEIVDPDNVALKTEYTYYEDSSETGKYGKRKTLLKPDGSWESYDYDDAGRKTVIVSSYKDAAFNSPADQAKAVYYDYIPVDADDVLTENDRRPRTVSVKVLGLTVSKTYFAYYTNPSGELVKIEEQCSAPGNSYGDSSNLRTTKTFYAPTADDASAGRVKTKVNPDGTMYTYLYEYGSYTSDPDPANCVFTPGEGAAYRRSIIHGTTAQPEGIPFKSTKEVRVTDMRGDEVLTETYACDASACHRIAWTVSVFNYDHKPLTVYRSDNTQTDATWNCCNKDSETLPDGTQYTYSYDLLNRVVSKTKLPSTQNPTPITHSYTYDAEGRRLSETVTGGSLTLSSFNTCDLAGRITSSTDASELDTSYTYENGGRKSILVYPGGATEVSDRYLDGRLKSVTGTSVIPKYYDYGVNPDGTTWTKVVNVTSANYLKTTFDALERVVKEEKPAFDGSVHTTIYSYNNKNQLIKVTQTGLADTLYEYDDLGSQTRSGLDINDNDSLDLASTDRISESETLFEQAGGLWFQKITRRVYATDNSATPTTTSISRTRLTGFTGNLVSETITTDINANETVSTTEIDRGNKTVTQTTDLPDSTIDERSETVNGLLTSSTTSTNLTFSYTYDALERLTGTLDPRTGLSTTIFYASGAGKIGKVQSVTDAAGNSTTFDYDSSTGRRTKVTDALSKDTLYTYNDRGQVLTVRGDASHPLDYSYDNFGRMTQLKTYRDDTLTTPDVTTWAYQNSTGLLTSKTYADDKSVNYTYTADGKLSTRTWARDSGSLVTSYSYDLQTGDLQTLDYNDSTPDISYTYNRLGQQLTVTDAVGTRAFTYNSALQPLTESITGLYSKTISRSYAATGVTGRYTGMNIGTELDIDYGYDTYGRFSTLTNGSDVYTYGYLPNSNLVSGITYPNTITVANSYEANRDLITSVDNKYGATTVSKYDYSNDALGRRTSMAKSGTAFAATDTINYTYNDKSEVTSADAVTDSLYNFAYNYDPIGNREDYTTYESGSAVTSEYTTNNLNQYTAITNPTQSPTYDDDGNMTNDGTWTFEWNGENRLIVATSGTITIEYQYDYMGRRVSRKVTEDSTVTEHTEYVYDGWNKIEELDALNSDNVDIKRVWGLDLTGSLTDAGSVGALLSETDSSETYYALYDANGNVSEYLDAAGVVQGHFEYSPFGKVVVESGTRPDDFSFRFSTKYEDALTGDLDYGLRDYDSKLGRWLSRDPIEEEGGENLYGMVGNDSINAIDYLGKQQHESPPTWFTESALKDQPCDCDLEPATFGGATIEILGGFWNVKARLEVTINGPYEELKWVWWTCWRRPTWWNPFHEESGYFPESKSSSDLGLYDPTAIPVHLIVKAYISWLSCECVGKQKKWVRHNARVTYGAESTWGGYWKKRPAGGTVKIE